MSNRNKKLTKQNKKSASAFKTWLVGALTDLLIGIILILIDKLIG